MNESLPLHESRSRESNMENDLVERAVCLTKEVKTNYQVVMQHWKEYNESWLKLIKEPRCSFPPSNNASAVTIPAHLVKRLMAETKNLKEMLPKAIKSEYMETFHKLHSAEEEVKNLERELKHSCCEVEYWKARFQAALEELEKEKAEKIRIHCELSELSKKQSDQSEYWTYLGSTVCTLLWRVSRNEDSVHSFIVGSKVDDFLIIVRQAMESYIATYQDEMPDEHTDLSQFVLALCGIITNIAAFACGREFLVTSSNGRSLLEIMMSFLSNTPVNHSAKLRCLILMCLYNVTINERGLKYITRVEGIIPLLAWLLTAENEVENQVNTLQLLRSITSALDKLLLQKVNEVLPNELLEQLVSSQNESIKEIAVELMMDLQTLQNEP